MRTVLSVSLPEQLSEELDRASKRTGRNKSDIVKESLSLFLWDMKLRAIQKTLGPKAKKRGLVSEEDIFKAIS
ncbi:CopG family transcriptional regulator [Candidatus Methylomirabilis lanthanidiphila]|uniref:CopG family transcriptional regulator n=1 Tax=Candidatus Methylomirabilis lanthanidiphila TaxID=2211376 RepID=A0A564ZMM5_9BACT|nr:CopG family transcriptional regulator [Candidatus Methylomirabilis lanthanidiphila]